MASKIISLLKIVWYSLRYFYNLKFCGISRIHGTAKINLKCGKAIFGKGITLKSGAYIAIVNNGELTIGDNTHVGQNCNIICHDSIKLGNRCALGPNVMIYDHDHAFGAMGLESGFRTAPVVIGDNCWIGAGVIILRGTTIGKGSVVGAGTIVKGKIPPYSLVISDRDMIVTPLGSR